MGDTPDPRLLAYLATVTEQDSICPMCDAEISMRDSENADSTTSSYIRGDNGLMLEIRHEAGCPLLAHGDARLS
jgi:hypothetical protein